MEQANSQISYKNGFLPEQEPLQRLPAAFEHWERTLDNLVELIKSNKLLEDVNRWQYVEPNNDLLTDERQWQRAYLVLTFVAHGILGANRGHYDSNDPPFKLPRVLAVPWSKVSSHLQLPTVTCYAAVVLYNWGLIEPEKGATPGNLKILHLYTGTKVEEWFYLVSMFCELAAAPGIAAAVEAFSAAKSKNARELTACLSRVASSLEDIKTTAKRMYDKCRPEVFYNEVRYFQSGYKGIVLEGVCTCDQPQEASGASAGQSSTIPVFDILLGVNFEEFTCDVTKKFLREQRFHMPGAHRAFLTDLARQPTLVRDYVVECQDAELTRLFNDCVKKLVKFRKCHIKLTEKMIVEPAAEEAVRKGKDPNLKGTGGSDFRHMLNEIITATEKSELKTD